MPREVTRRDGFFARAKKFAPLFGLAGEILVIFVALCACKRASSDSPKATSSAASAGAAVASAPATPTASVTTPAGTSPQIGGCPYRRRCEAGCKKAHFAALETCKKESDEFFGSLPDSKALGECSAGCLKIPNNAGCVGGTTKPECDCMIKCSDGLPPDIRKKGEVYVACYAKAVTAYCD